MIGRRTEPAGTTAATREPYSNDAGEPIHVHVERDGDVAKFWLDPVRLQRSGGFRPPEIIRISRLVEVHREQIMEARNECFGR